MKAKCKFLQTMSLCAFVLGLNFTMTSAATMDGAKKAEKIPWDQIGAKAGANYHGGGLAVTRATDSARLHCVFQRLEGEATREGLWLVSTVPNTLADRFQVKAAAISRTGMKGATDLSTGGEVVVDGQNVSFVRSAMTEEYSVSMDGVRQDFVVTEKPAGAGELEVRLAVRGAKVTQATYGAQLVLDQTVRKIAYNRLRVTDAAGKELPARLDARLNHDLAVMVQDAGAVYPVRIDPTFSDANWFPFNQAALEVAGNTVSGYVDAAVTDGFGNLYICGIFNRVFFGFGDTMTVATNIAKWNGSNWSAVGSGISDVVDGFGPTVYALAVDSSGNLYTGGNFTNAGRVVVNNVAKWNGNAWSALGSGMDLYGFVNALAVSGGTLYAGGQFTHAGGNAANSIAQWNGSSWSPLGSGINSPDIPEVAALAVSGSTLLAGGSFDWAGTNYMAINLAMANLPVSVDIIANNAAFGFTNGVFGFNVSGSAGSNVVIQASTNLQTWTPLQTNLLGLLGNGLLYFSDAQSTTNVQRFYRAQLSP